MEGRPRVAVIGAGAVGAAIALRLHLDGLAVTLLDPDPAGRRGASWGNAGHIGAASVVPWANPSNRRTALASRRDPLHPLRFDAIQTARHPAWVARWLRASTKARAERGAGHLAALLASCYPSLMPLLEAAGASHLLRRDGLLHVFQSEAAYRAAEAGFEQRRRHGVRVEPLSLGALRELEPAIATGNRVALSRAVLLPDVGQVLDPGAMVVAFLARFRRDGGVVERRRVEAIRPMPDAVRLEPDEGERRGFDRVVVAAGAASMRLARPLGARVPLIAERGTHLQFDAGGDLLTRSVLFVDRRVVFSPMARGLRLTTGAEFTDPATPPDPRAMDSIFAAAHPLLPAVPPIEEAERWTGDRPSTPDSLPVIGPAPRDGRVLLAYGHGHTGLTLAAPTAALVSDLVCGRAPALDLGPFAADRPP